MKPVFKLHRGSMPLLVSVPHAGTWIPETLHGDYLERALGVEDTDWHLERVYAFVRDKGASFITPRASRYVIDLNRPPEDTPMYAGVNNTELCPTHFFTGDKLYRPGREPGTAEIGKRRDSFWRPYHGAILAELERLRAEHGHAVLFDGHSIRAEVPWLFEGRLPDLNLGTVSGTSCAPTLRAALARVLEEAQGFTHVIDGRFKGGYITRHYGRPAERIHAVQLEMVQALYMDEQPPFALDAKRAKVLQPVLERLVDSMLAWRPAR